MNRKVGASVLRTTNNTARFLKRLARAKARAARAMAEETLDQALQVYFTDGDGEWDRNAPGTIAWKGFDAPMAGRTATLSRDIRIKDSEIPGIKEIGWFEDPHPDTEGRLSMGALATVHEFGSSEDNPVDIPARPWLSKVHDNEARAAAVYAAGERVYRQEMT